MSSVRVDARGASGGNGISTIQTGGLGGRTVADVPVTPGETLMVLVGGRGGDGGTGTGGFNGGAFATGNGGGGGGGATAILRGSTDLVVAGGGGGSGARFTAATASAGSGAGGSGGGGDGQAGEVSGGGGGTASAAGAGGVCVTGWQYCSAGYAGSGPNGGIPNGCGSAGSGGGGGGGWFGGGGGAGACDHSENGGGGGSGHVDASAASVETDAGFSVGDGQVTVTWPAGGPAAGPASGRQDLVGNGQSQFFTVPFGVSSIFVAAGGAQSGGSGAGGGVELAIIPVTPGSTLVVNPGTTPTDSSGGFNGGALGQSPAYGGSGASDVRVGGPRLMDRVVIGAGAGGAGAGGTSGGAGGGEMGGTGIGGPGGFGANASTGGSGGSQTAGGTGGIGSYAGAGNDGTIALGGDGNGGCQPGGGGGGGGYYGGGGGGGRCYGNGGSGGGGSSFPAAASSTAQTYTGLRVGTGKVTIVWPAQAGWAEFTAMLQPHEEYDACHCNRRLVQPVWSGDPVNMADGSFTESATDLGASPGRGPGLAVRRSYNSDSATVDGPFGFGWAFSYNMSLSFTGMPSSPTAVTELEEGGGTTTWNQNGTSYTPENSRVTATLTQNANGTWTVTRNQTSMLDFDATGKLVAIRDLNGYSVTLSYSGSQLATSTDSAGLTYTFSWSGTHLSGVHDNAAPQRSVSYGYDTAGNLTDVIDVAGGHTVYTYGADPTHHQLTTLRTPRFYGDTTTTPTPITTNHYTSGRVDTQTDPNGHVTTWDYATVPGSTIQTSPEGRKVLYTYSQGVLVSMTKGYGTAQAAQWGYVYDPRLGGVAMVVDPNGHVSANHYDDRGNATSTVDGLGRTTIRTFNQFNEPLTVTDPKGITTTYTYDTAGNPLTVSTPLLDPAGNAVLDGSGHPIVSTRTWHYTDSSHPGDVHDMVDPDGKTWTYGYNTVGDRVTVTDPIGDTTRSCLDTNAWLTATIAPLAAGAGTTCAQVPAAPTAPPAHVTSYTRDRFGQTTSTVDSLGHSTVTHYDPDRNVDYSIDADTNRTNLVRDAIGQLLETRRPDGSVVKTSYWPDNLTEAQTDAAGNVTSYTFDPLGRVATDTTPPTQACSSGCPTRFGYDGAGNRVTITDASGRVTTNHYDAANELTAISYSDAGTPNVTNIGYDRDGQRTTVTDGTGTSSWAFDSLRRLTTASTPAGGTVSYGHDLRGDNTSIVYPSGVGTVTRGFDDAGRLRTVTDWLGHQSKFDPDADSNPGTDTYGNGDTTVWNPDNADRIMGITHQQGAPTLASFTYTRDANNQVTRVTTTGLNDTHGYNYNALNFITTVDTNPATVHRYDTADNLVQQPDATTVQGFDAANELTSKTTPITFMQQATAADSTGNATSLTANLAATAANDQILVAVSVATSATVTVPDPTRYALVANQGNGDGNKVVVYRYTAAAGDNHVTLNFPNSSASNLQLKTLAAVVYRGVDAVNPVDDTKGAGGLASDLTNPDPITVGSTNATTSPDQLVMVLSAVRLTPPAGSWTVPATMTKRADVGTTSLTNITDVADETLNTSGATGSRTATFSVTATSRNGVLVALRPAGIAYGYDAQGDRTTVTPPNGAVTTYGYDQAQRLTSITSDTTPISAYTYRGDGLRATKTVGAATTSFGWDDAGSLPLLLTETTGGQQTNYVYGPGGRVIEQISTRPSIVPVQAATNQDPTGLTSSTLTATFSAATQLNDQVIVVTSAENGATITPPSSGYTKVEELTNGTSAIHTVMYNHTAAAGETNVTFSYSGNQARTIAAVVYRNVDPNNPIDAHNSTEGFARSLNIPGVTTTDTGDQLVVAGGAQSLVPASGTWTTPSGSGWTREATIGTTGADNSTAIADKTLGAPGSTGDQTISYSSTAPALAGIIATLKRIPTPVLYYQPDQLGSTRLVTDNTGAIAATYTYDPYGKLTATAVTPGHVVNNPFGYAGQYTDAESGLQYLRARYYDPTTGQFLTRDPLAAKTRDPYGYAGRSPLSFRDLTGRDVGDLVNDVTSEIVDHQSNALDAFTGYAAGVVAAKSCLGRALGQGSSYAGTHLGEAAGAATALEPFAEGLPFISAATIIGSDLANGDSNAGAFGEAAGSLAFGYLGQAVGLAVCGAIADGTGGAGAVTCGALSSGFAFAGGLAGGYIGGSIGDAADAIGDWL